MATRHGSRHCLKYAQLRLLAGQGPCVKHTGMTGAGGAPAGRQRPTAPEADCLSHWRPHPPPQAPLQWCYYAKLSSAASLCLPLCRLLHNTMLSVLGMVFRNACPLQLPLYNTCCARHGANGWAAPLMPEQNLAAQLHS